GVIQELELFHADATNARLAVLVRGEGRDAKGLAVVGPAEKAAHFWSDVVVAASIHDGFHTDGCPVAAFQRLDGLDIDRRADTARGRGSVAGLVHLEAAHPFRGESGEVEGARGALRAGVGGVAGNRADVRRRKLAAVQGHEVEAGAEAAHRHRSAFAVYTVDGYTGDALQRLGEVGVRELADVLGRNCIDDT